LVGWQVDRRAGGGGTLYSVMFVFIYRDVWVSGTRVNAKFLFDNFERPIAIFEALGTQNQARTTIAKMGNCQLMFSIKKKEFEV
jgi:hypothetical protein